MAKKFYYPPAPGNGKGTFSDNLVGMQITEGSPQMTLGNFSISDSSSSKQEISFDLGGFSGPITLEQLDAGDTNLSRQALNYSLLVDFNYDYSDISNLVLYGSLKERLRVSAQEIVNFFPAALYCNGVDIIVNSSGNTVENISYEVPDQNTIVVSGIDKALVGEVSANMLTNIGIKSVILGHSERRTYFKEDDMLLTQKVKAALENHLEVIFCFGEHLEDRKSGNHFSVVESQLKNTVFHLDANAWKNIVLAYEPVWAIGTGETASPEQAQEMHAFIRGLLKEAYTNEVAENVSILYGGSVKPANAVEIFSKEDVDGGLIGGASLNAGDFTAIIKAI